MHPMTRLDQALQLTVDQMLGSRYADTDLHFLVQASSILRYRFVEALGACSNTKEPKKLFFPSVAEQPRDQPRIECFRRWYHVCRDQL